MLFRSGETPPDNPDPEAASTDAAVAAADATGEPGEAVGEVVDPDAEIVDEQMDAIDDIQEESSDVEEDVDTLTEATESLEVCVAALEAAIETGGLDMIGSTLLRNNLNTVTRHLKVKQLLIPALEDMESPSAKIDAASTTKDQIVAFIRRIIDTIKSAFVRFGQWIVETYKRLTDAFVALERRAETLAAKVSKSTMKEGQMDNAGLAKKLMLGDKPATDVPAYLTTLDKFAKYLNEPGTYKPYLSAIDECETLLKDAAKEEEARGKITAQLNTWSEAIAKQADGITTGGDSKALPAPGGTSQTKSFGVTLLDGQQLNVVLPLEAGSIGAMNAAVSNGTAAAPGGSVEALDKAEAAKICDLVTAISKSTRESSAGNKAGVKTLMSELDKRKSTIVAMSSAMGDRATKEGGDSAAYRKIVIFINTMLMSGMKLPVHGLNRALPRNLSIALDYVAASIGVAESTSTAVAAA